MSNSVMVAAIIVALPCIAGVQPPPTSKADAVNRATASYRGIELPAAKTGTGPHDFYSLFARLPIVTETIYGIGIATNNKVSQDDAQVVAEGLGTLKVDRQQQFHAPMFHKVDYIEATFSRKSLERASRTGTKVQVTSSKGSLQFMVPDWIFAALIEAADKKDYRRKFEAAESERKQAEQEARQTYVKAHPDLSEHFKNAILEGSVVLGMSPDEVRASWGAPSRVNKTVNAYAVSEQWVYGNTYVYLENGKATSWQSSQ